MAAIFIFFSVFVVLLSPGIRAETVNTTHEKIWPSDPWENFKSPISTEASQPLLTGALLTGLLLAFEDQVSDPLQKEASEKKLKSNYSKIGDFAGKGSTNIIYAVSALSYGLIDSD